MEITPKMVTGYANAVATALTDAGHQLTAPTVDGEELTAEIVIPDALTDEHQRCGVALDWDREEGWIASYHDETGRYPMPTDLRLGIVPEPGTVVKAVRAIAADGNLRNGRILPDTAELLTRYEKTPAWVDTAWTPEEVQGALTGGDPEWQFGWCVYCGAEDVNRFALVQLEGRRELVRVAWCSRERCRADRDVSSRMPRFWVKRGEDGVFRLSELARCC